MKIDSFRVVPALPERLAGLREIAYNLLWSWGDDLRVVFSSLDRELWDRTYQNPVLMLGTVAQERLESLDRDESFLAYLDRAVERLHAYLRVPTFWDRRFADRPLIAYFSAEYGIAECLPIYSGGLGVLSGHNLKSASDLGIPLVGVGLLYQQGYFRQYLSSDGWQQESYPVNDFYNVPVQVATGSEGAPVRVEVDLAGRRALVQVWKAEVGRIPLYLLDTNLPENPPEIQDTFDYFTDAINGEEGASRSDFSPIEDDNVTVQGVAGDKGALGYFGFSYFEQNQDTLKALEIDGGKGCVAPSVASAQDGSYTPLSRPLFMYVKKSSLTDTAGLADFVRFTLENEQTIAEEAQFVPLSQEQIDEQFQKLEDATA